MFCALLPIYLSGCNCDIKNVTELLLVLVNSVVPLSAVC